jgi:hypothetical protein
MAGWRFWWWRCQRIGGAFEGCRLVEHVPAITLVARLGSGCGEFLGALAILAGTALCISIGHWTSLPGTETGALVGNKLLFLYFKTLHV